MKQLFRDSATIAVKELKQLGRDPVSLALTIIFPILLVGIFVVIASAFGAASYNVAVVVADLDSSSASKMLTDKLTSSSLIRVTEILQTEEQAVHAVEIGSVVGGVVIPKGFGDALANQRNAFLIVETDNSKITASSIVVSAVGREAQELMMLFSTGAAPIQVISRPISGRPPTGDPILPGMLGMITILGAFDDIVNAITRERERGTFPRLILTPVNLFSIYSGKMIATVVLNAVRTSFMLAILVLTGLTIRGNILLVYLITSLIAIFTLSLGLAFSSRIRSSSTLTILEIAITFPLFQLAGTFQSPQLLAPGGKNVALILPWTYGNMALRRVIYLGLGLDAITGELLVLLFSSLILLPIATLLSKRTI